VEPKILSMASVSPDKMPSPVEKTIFIVRFRILL